MKSKHFRMKSLLFVGSIMLFGLAADGFAQGHGGMAKPDSAYIAALFDSLAANVSLTYSQKPKVRVIYVKALNDIGELPAKFKGEPMAMMKERSKIAGKRDEDIKKLLTEKQKKAYDAHLAAQRAKMRLRMRGGGMPHGDK